MNSCWWIVQPWRRAISSVSSVLKESSSRISSAHSTLSRQPASETALFYLSHEELRGMRTGTARDRMAAALMRHPDRLLTAVLFWNLVVNLTYFATSVVVGMPEQLVSRGIVPPGSTLSVEE